MNIKRIPESFRDGADLSVMQVGALHDHILRLENGRTKDQAEITRLHACEGNSILRATNAEAEVVKAEEEILRRGFQINELTGRAVRAEDLIERQTATIRELRERVEKAETPPAPLPLFLTCPNPKCCARHIDEGEWATKPHHTHSCQSCGLSWRPAVADTVGVRFLPGFKSESVPEAKPETSPRIMGLMEQIETAEEIKPCPRCRGAGIGLGIYSQAMGLVCGLCKGAKKVRRVPNTKEFGRSPYRWVPVHEDGTLSEPMCDDACKTRYLEEKCWCGLWWVCHDKKHPHVLAPAFLGDIVCDGFAPPKCDKVLGDCLGPVCSSCPARRLRK